MRLYLSVILLFVSLYGLSQTAVKDFEKVKAYYKQFDEMSMNIVYYSYEDGQDEQYSEAIYGQYYRKGNKFYNKKGASITLQDDNMMLIIQQKNKVIGIKRPIDITGKYGAEMDVEAFLNMSKEVIPVKSENSVAYKLVYNSPTSFYDAMEIHLDKSEYFISKLVYHLKQMYKDVDGIEKLVSPRIEVHYKNIKTDGVSDNFFKTNKYVIKEQNKYKASPQYWNYRVMNELD